ncbi:MAG: respiratory nitrate reductase subunit gamma [Gallionellaceae bacterium]|jgi:nitrate reductase gamma subunit
MTMTIMFAVLFYFAAGLLTVGLIYRITIYARTPAPLKIPTTPAPRTSAGVVMLMAREVFLFQSLFKGNLWTWLFSIMFHAGLALVLLRHLRYFIDPVWSWVIFIQPFGIYAGFLMVAGLAGLWGRRFFVDRVRYISTPSDHLMLALLIAIGVSGLVMKFVTHTDIVAIKNFFIGLMSFSLHPLPTDNMIYLHLSLIALLMIIFPFSKLLHAPGLFFSPSRNQVDNSRDVRHISAWAAKLESEK